MNKKFKIAFSLSSIALLAGCNLEVNPGGTAIMTAVNYTGEERIVYSLDDDYETPGGEGSEEEGYRPKHRIAKGDYKPVWSTLQNRLGINLLEHQAAANSGDKKSVAYFRDNWMTKTYADISMGTVYDINNYSVAGNRATILDLKPYIEETKFETVQDPRPGHEGEKIEVVDEDHKGYLPNFALFLHNNPGVELSIVTAQHSNPNKGAIYYVPYFDGFDEIDKSPIMRADYIKRLLDDDPDEHVEEGNKYKFSEKKGIIKPHGTTGEKIYTQNYEPCYVAADGKTTIQYSVSLPNVDGEGKVVDHEKPTISFTKKETTNIIKTQNDSINNGSACSKLFAEQFRDYINARYGTPGTGGCPFEHYSDLFLGWKACYDSDELVALMRLVKVSSGTLFKEEDQNGKWHEIEKEMVTFMPRTCDNQRSSDIYRWGGQVFGVRGPESRNSNVYMYISGEKSYGQYGKYGAVHDACGREDMLWLLNKLRNLYQEGLILQDFDSKTATGTSEGKFADETLFSGGSDNYAGFMVYDWARDLNDCNKYPTAKREKGSKCDWRTMSPNGDTTEGELGYSYDLRAVIGAVAQWDIDGDGKREPAEKGGFMPFTESWTSLKTSALCLNARLPENPEKLKATFDLIDYVYSPAGMYLYNYGPWEDGYITKIAGEGDLYVEGAKPDIDYIEYQGERYPQLTNAALKEYQDKTGYQRRFIGASLPFGFRKLSVVPYLTMETKTKHGMDVVNKAIELETFKHVLIGGNTEQQKKDIKIPFYQICPSAFFLTKGQSSAISSLLDKNKLGSIFTDSSTSNFNIWDALIMGQSTRLGVTLDNYLDKMKEWGIEKLETYYQDAFEIMSDPIPIGKDSIK